MPRHRVPAVDISALVIADVVVAVTPGVALVFVGVAELRHSRQCDRLPRAPAFMGNYGFGRQ
jgi:hypothetical protein